MKKESNDILSKLGKDAGFKTPDNYFADFSKNLMDQLPEVTITEPVQEKPTLWTRVRTYVYMAAMFGGIYCMMNLFNMHNGTADGGQPGIQATTPAGQGTNPAIVSDKAADTQKMSYEDSVRMSQEQPATLPQSANE